MPETILPQIAGIIVLGAAAQWLAWRAALPSILLLLLFGLIAGPVTGWLNPDELFGDLITPAVSIAVALILYEGGLTLKLSEITKVRGVVRNLVTIGALVTWFVGALAAYLIFDLSIALAALLGAVLVVTGPTVIVPLLHHIRPTGSVGAALKWEGIVIDPIGALLTVLIFEVIVIGKAGEATAYVALAVAKTVFLGGGLGVVAAGLLVLLIKRYWIPDYLQNAVSLMLVVGTFVLSNLMQEESGLLAVTVMGFALANQRWADVGEIVEFKENLRVLLISALFVVLAARLNPADLRRFIGPGLVFVAVLALVARPLSVWLSTYRSELSGRQRMFLAWMAPRGIVAAAVASVFTLRLQQRGYEGAEVLAPITFIIIIATVALYGLSAPFVARKLGVAESNPQGVLFTGAHGWARAVASLLNQRGYRVLLVDSNWDNVHAARMAGLPAYSGSILGEETLERLDLGGVGRLLAITPNDWVNVLAVQRFVRIFGRAECYQLPPRQEGTKKQTHKYLHGRWLFGEEADYAALSERFARGFIVKASNLTEKFDYAAYRAYYGDSAVPLFVINESKRLRVLTSDANSEPQVGETLISLVKEPEEQNRDARRAVP